MRSIVYRISDLLEKMRTAGLTSTTVTKFAGVFDEEWFRREERLGANDTVAWELRYLTDFLLERILPLAGLTVPNVAENNAESQFESFVRSNISDATLSHEVTYSSHLQGIP